MFNGIKVAVVSRIALLLGLLLISCVKENVSIQGARVKVPVRNYTVTARINNKEANNDSEASGLLKGNYDENSKELSFTISFEGVDPLAINVKEGPRGTNGTLLWKVATNSQEAYKSPVNGKRILTALQERNLIKGNWFITIDSQLRKPEIRGIITLKQK